MSTAELVVFIALVAAIVLGSIKLMAAANRSPALRGRTPSWRPAVRPLSTGGYQVVVEREGEPRQLVREIPAGLDGADLSEAMAEGRADAEEQADALNAAGLPRTAA